MVRVYLFDLSVQGSEIRLLAVKIYLRLFHDHAHTNETEHGCRNGHQRKNDARAEHFYHYAHQKHDRSEKVCGALRKGLAYRIDIIGHSRKYVSLGARIEKAQGQAVNFPVDIVSQSS